jgi:hypothetical protein
MGMDEGGVMPALRLMATGVLPYRIEQRHLLPPDLRESVP